MEKGSKRNDQELNKEEIRLPDENYRVSER